MQDIEPPYTEPYVRWCERSTSQLMASFLLDCGTTTFGVGEDFSVSVYDLGLGSTSNNPLK